MGENTTAQTLVNCPTEEAFHLEVYRHAGVRQVLQTYPVYNVKTFERNYYNNNWSDWHRVPQDADINSLNSTIANKADKNHTHGKNYSSGNIAKYVNYAVYGNIGILSWDAMQIQFNNKWTDLWTLPVTNRGITVQSPNTHLGTSTYIYFRIPSGSNKVQGISTVSSGQYWASGGELIFFVD